METDKPNQSADLETNTTAESRAKQRWRNAFAAYKNKLSTQSNNATVNNDQGSVILRENASLHNSSSGTNPRRVSPNKLLHDINQGEI